MKFLLIILIALGMNVIACSQSKPDPRHIVKIGDTAPDFTLKFLDGSSVKLSELRGNVVMLQFTASWCSVCLKEMPHIESEIWLIHKDNQHFKLYGVDYKEDKSTIEKFIDKTKISYPILLDEDGKIFELYAEKDAGVTRNVIIDKEGKIRFLTRLFVKEEFDEMKSVIEKLLQE